MLPTLTVNGKFMREFTAAGAPCFALGMAEEGKPTTLAERLVMPLSVDEVARFWSSFRTSRDLAIVGLMLLQGLRSNEVIALNCEDVLRQSRRCGCAARAIRFASFRWLRIRSCYWTSICGWNGPSNAAQHCSSRCKDRLGVCA